MTTFTTYANPWNDRAVLGPRPGGEPGWSGGRKGSRRGDVVGVSHAVSRCRTAQPCQRVLVSDQPPMEVPS